MSLAAMNHTFSSAMMSWFCSELSDDKMCGKEMTKKKKKKRETLCEIIEEKRTVSLGI